jgi:3-methyladenine DNA glycosylase AlkD
MTELQERLFAMQDESYRDFQCKLMPTVAREAVIGVRTPMLRALAKNLRGTWEATAFLSSLPHRYYEENNLHAFLIEQITDFDACVAALDAFLPCVNNWATCDSMNPKVLGKHKDRLLPVIERWLDSKDTYAVRFGIKLLMTWFLDEDFEERYLARVARIRSEEYYVNMMIAWYFATALAKQYAATLPYLEEHRLPDWIHAKTVRKAIESYRISKEQKDHLRTL